MTKQIGTYTCNCHKGCLPKVNGTPERNNGSKVNSAGHTWYKLLLTIVHNRKVTFRLKWCTFNEMCVYAICACIYATQFLVFLSFRAFQHFGFPFIYVHVVSLKTVTVIDIYGMYTMYIVSLCTHLTYKRSECYK